MADLKDLQEMAKNGEISEKLLGDEHFKSEFKKILKEKNGVDIKDDQLPEIIKNFERALQDEKVLKESELEDVSGGRKKRRYEHDDLDGKDKVRAVGTALGAVLGAFGGVSLGMSLYDDPINQMDEETRRSRIIQRRNRQDKVYDKILGTKTYHLPEPVEAGPIHTVGAAGALAGATVGFGVSELILKALGT